MSRGNQPKEPEWMARPSGDCCLQGHLHTGEPKGKFEHLTDIETYVVEPPSDKANGHVILYYPDVFGFFTNGLLVMDSFAEAGYLVIGIDYFRGDPVFMYRDGPKQPKEGFDFEAWLAKHTDFAEKHVPGWVEAVKGKYGKEGRKWACVGYCFGAPYVMNSISPLDGSPPVCDVGAFAHPAFLKEHHFRNIERPLFFSCAEDDFTFPTEFRNKAIDMLIEDKKQYHLQLFQGVAHGFALRCDLSKPYERWCKEQSVKGISEYFDLQLGVFEERTEGKESKL